MIRGAGGYAQIVDPDRPLVERDTVTCAHCSALIFTKPHSASTVYLLTLPSGHLVEEPGAFCRLCMRPICLPCHDHGRCRPLEAWLEQVESRGV